MKIIMSFLLSLCLFLSACSSSNSNATPAIQGARYAYVVNIGETSITQYALGPAGTMTAIGTPIATGAFPQGIAMDLMQKYLYVANMGEDTIYQYSINADGTLSTLGNPVATQMAPQSLILSPDGKFVFVTETSNSSISKYQITSTGELSLVSTVALADSPANMIFSPSGLYSYVLNYDSSISQYSYDSADGTMTPLTPAVASVASCPSGPLASYKSNQGGEYIYALSCSTAQLEMFSIGSDGTLTSRQVVATGIMPTHMQVSGSYIYVTNAGDGTISKFAIQFDGTLRLAQNIAAGDSPESLSIDTKGNLAYVLDFSSDQILQYSLDSVGNLPSAASAAAKTDANPSRVLLKY